MIELTDELIAAQVARAEAALACAESLTLAPAESETPADTVTHDLFDGMPRAFLDSALAAQAQGRVLLCDDRAMRAMADGTLSVAAAWTQVVLQSAVQAGELEQRTYSEAAVKLVEANYHFTMFGEAELIHVLRQSDWELSPRFDKLISVLSKESTEVASIRSLLAALIISAWRESPNKHVFRGVFQKIASSLNAARATLDVQDLFQAAFDLAAHELEMRAIGIAFKESLKETSFRTSVQSIVDRLKEPAERLANRIANELSAALDAATLPNDEAPVER